MVVIITRFFILLKKLHQILSIEMKECDLCNKQDTTHFRVKSINFKDWIFCCKECWITVSKQSRYSYGGTRKSKRWTKLQ